MSGESGFYHTVNLLRKYQVKNKNTSFDHTCMDKGIINFGDSSITAEELFKLYSKGKKHIAAVPHCLINTRLLFDIDSLNGFQYNYIKSTINRMVHKLFKSSKDNYIHLEEKNESVEKYHIRYPNIIVSKTILRKICDALNNYFAKIVIDPECYTLRYPGFDKFHSNKKQWLSKTSYYPINGSSLTLEYYKQCYLHCDDLKTTPLKIKESSIRPGLLFINKGKKGRKHRNINKIMYKKTELVSTQVILDAINNDKSLLLDANKIVIGIKKNDDELCVDEIGFNSKYTVENVVYIAINVTTLRTGYDRKLMLYDIRSCMDRLTCSGNTKPQQLWVNMRSKYIDMNNNNNNNEIEMDEKQKDEKVNKRIRKFYDNIYLTTKELKLKNELFEFVRDCIVELNKEKEFNESKWDIVKFGSFAMNVCINTSDIDVAIYIKENDIPRKIVENLILESLSKLIKRKTKNNDNINVIELLKYPIITVKDKLRGDVDVRIGNKCMKERENIIIKLINKYEKFGYKIKDLIVFIKYWSKKRGINNGSKGYLNSFGYTMMSIKYLQSIMQQNNYKHNTMINLYEFIEGFFSFYMHKFDNNKHCICINNNDSGYDKQLFEVKTMNKCVLQIMDPMDKHNNVARMVQV
eukprot:451882_1